MSRFEDPFSVEPIGVAELGEVPPKTTKEIQDAVVQCEQDLALDRVQAELERAYRRFGDQSDLPVSRETKPRSLRELATIFANMSKEDNKRNAKNGTLNWHDILTEEFWEAFAEDPDENPEAFETELYQVAAVAIRIALANRRRRGAA
jgi:hypothetical protein